MIRLISILAIITLLSLVATWLANSPGHVVIDWSNYHIEASVLLLVAGIFIAALSCLIIYCILYGLLRAPSHWQRSRLARHQTLGLESLTSAFAAIATQDMRAARRHIASAHKYLPHQPLTLMLASQLARLEGNESQSRLYLENMLKAEGTEFMALRGLIENARRSHDDDAAIKHAEQALKIKKDDHWIATTLIGLYVNKHRSQDALKLIDSTTRNGAITRKEKKYFTAAVLVEHARPFIEQKRYEMALPALTEALRIKSDCVSASTLLAKIYIAEGDTARAIKCISKAWKIMPHPLLTQALAECAEPIKTRGKILRTAEKLARIHPENRESRFLLATIGLKLGNTDSARNEVNYLLHERETTRACALMAEIENTSGENVESSHWLKRSLFASPEPGYECTTCHQPSDDWHLTCPHCSAVGTIQFGSLPQP